MVEASKTFEHNGLDEVEDPRLQVEATLAWKCTCNLAPNSISQERQLRARRAQLRTIDSFTYACLLNVATLGFYALLKLLG